MTVIRFGSDPARQKFFSRVLRASFIRLVARRQMIEHDLGEPVSMGLKISGGVEHRQNELPRRRETLLKGVQIIPVEDIRSWHGPSIARQ